LHTNVEFQELHGGARQQRIDNKVIKVLIQCLICFLLSGDSFIVLEANNPNM